MSRIRDHLQNRLSKAPADSTLARIAGKLALLAAKLRDDKYKGVSGKLLFAAKVVRYALDRSGFATALSIPVYLAERLAFAALRRRLAAATRPRRAKLLLIQPNGLGDAVINKPYTDIIARHAASDPRDVVILASSAWTAFRNTIHEDCTVLTFNSTAFETSRAYRQEIYRTLAGYTFDTAICNLRWKVPNMVQNLLASVTATRKYICLCHQKHKHLNRRLRLWSALFDVTCLDTNAEPNELKRIPLMYSMIFGQAGPAAPQRAQLRRPAHIPSFKEDFGRFVVFHLGNAEASRRWPLEKYIAVGDYLKSQGCEVVFCGGPNEVDMTNERLSAFKCLINALSADEYTALLADASAVLAGDTGPAHLAIALGTPTAVLLGGGHYDNYFPYPADVQPPPAGVEYISNAMQCFHCDWACDQNPIFACIHGIAADDAIRAMRRLLTLP